MSGQLTYYPDGLNFKLDLNAGGARLLAVWVSGNSVSRSHFFLFLCLGSYPGPFQVHHCLIRGCAVHYLAYNFKLHIE